MKAHILMVDLIHDGQGWRWNDSWTVKETDLPYESPRKVARYLRNAGYLPPGKFTREVIYSDPEFWEFKPRAWQNHLIAIEWSFDECYT